MKIPGDLKSFNRSHLKLNLKKNKKSTKHNTTLAIAAEKAKLPTQLVEGVKHFAVVVFLRVTFPQSLWLSVVADGIFAFFLLALSFSPALTTSLVSFLQVGQYLGGNHDEANTNGGGGSVPPRQ